MTGLSPSCLGHDRDELSEHALAHELAGLGEDRAVSPVMADEQRHGRCLRGFDKSFGPVDRVCDRLLHKYRHSGSHALESMVDVERGWRRHDDAVGPFCRQQISPQ